jgi:hypothetical protein
MLLEPVKEKERGTFLNKPLFMETLICPHQEHLDPDARNFRATDGGATEQEYLALLQVLVGIFKPTHICETGVLWGDGSAALIQALIGTKDEKHVLSIGGNDLPGDVSQGLRDIAEKGEVGFRFLKANTNTLMDENTWSQYTGGKTTFAFLDSSIPDRVREFDYISNLANGVLDFERPLCVCVHDMSKYRHPKDDATEYLQSTVEGLYELAEERGWEVLRLNQSRGMIFGEGC